MRSLTSLVSGLCGLLLLDACSVDSRKPVESGEAETEAEPGASSVEPGMASVDPGEASGEPARTSAGTAPETPAPTPMPAQTIASQLDLLFVIDNSISMSDKQALLGQVGNVLERFVRPRCVDDAGNQFPATIAARDCPEGQHRQFTPVTDVHLGVISTSMGDAGAEVACPSFGNARYVPDRIDNAHLLGTLPRGNVPGISSAGFISWRAGEDELAAATSFAALVNAVGEDGCGWEMPLEAWYRFLVDPRPYAQLERVDCPSGSRPGTDCVQAQTDAEGSVVADEQLLAQRRSFLRPTSLLGVVMLSDENDCSLVVGGQNWSALAIDAAEPFFRGSSVCAQNPNDPCCYSCPLDPPQGCAEDPTCEFSDSITGQLENRLASADDGQNLRCFHQKQRFGTDFLYPVARYVNALTQPTLCATRPDLAAAGCAAPEPNPLFAGGRAPTDVFLAGIVGVPSELIEAQVDAPGRPALANGFRYKIASELSAADWDALVGDSSASPPVPPSNPFMIESPTERADIPPGNPINGREHSTADIRVTDTGTTEIPDDLQFACILPLPAPRDCALADPALDACDCYPGENDSPLCEQVPGQSAAGTVQYWGKAYPGTRQLELLRQLGQQAVVGSICAPNTTLPDAADFSYRPAIAALVDSMAPRLQTP